MYNRGHPKFAKAKRESPVVRGRGRNMIFLKAFLLNLQFFTSIPIRLELPVDKAHITRAISLFPLLGLFQGAIVSFVLYGLVEWTPISSVGIAFIISLVGIFLTGGIHLDGWIDTNDAFFSYRDQAKRLEIMNDPRTGAFGVLAVIILLGGRFLFLYEVIDSGVTGGLLVLIALIPCLSRTVMGVLLVNAPLAKPEGLAYYFRNHSDPDASTRDGLLLALICVLVSVVYSPQVSFHLMVGVFLAVGAYFFLKKKAVAWFGGITGDVLGASVEGVEWGLWMVLWLSHYAVMV